MHSIKWSKTYAAQHAQLPPLVSALNTLCGSLQLPSLLHLLCSI